eukprot:scaffold20494_cov69-Phaeocystis_antarctica.AAC.5
MVELRQHSSRRQRTCRQWRHEGGDALVAEWVASETELLQRGPPPQGRREGHQPRVTDGGVAQMEALEPRQGASAQGGSERLGPCVAQMHITDRQRGYGWQSARAQPLNQPLHAHLERRQHRAQCRQRRQVSRREVLVDTLDRLRLAQFIAAPLPHLAGQPSCRLVLSPQLLQQRLRERPQLAVGAAEGHGDAWIERVAQLAEDDALLVTAQRRERHRGPRPGARRAARGRELGEEARGFTQSLKRSSHQLTERCGWLVDQNYCSQREITCSCTIDTVTTPHFTPHGVFRTSLRLSSANCQHEQPPAQPRLSN